VRAYCTRLDQAAFEANGSLLSVCANAPAAMVSNPALQRGSRRKAAGAGFTLRFNTFFRLLDNIVSLDYAITM